MKRTWNCKQWSSIKFKAGIQDSTQNTKINAFYVFPLGKYVEMVYMEMRRKI